MADRIRLRRPLGLERLDDRITPVILTWDGEGGNGKWTTAQNWRDAEGKDATPAAGDDLVFDATVKGLGSIKATNDFPADTPFASIQAVTIEGKAVELTGNSVTLSGTGVSVTGQGGNTTFGLPVTFADTNQQVSFADRTGNPGKVVFDKAAPITLTDGIELTFRVDAPSSIAGGTAGSVTIQSTLTGDGSVVKDGDGLLIVESTLPNDYTGRTKVVAGELRLAVGAKNGGIPGDLEVVGTSRPATVRIDGAVEQIAEQRVDPATGAVVGPTTVKVGFNGVLDLGGADEEFGNLELAGGTIEGGGIIRFDTVRVTTTQQTVIGPTIDLEDRDLTLFVPGPTNPAGKAVLVLGAINGGSDRTLTFAGTGVTKLTQPAVPGGNFKTVVAGGALQLSNQAGGANPLLPGDVTIQSGGIVSLVTGDGIADEAAVTLEGNGQLITDFADASLFGGGVTGDDDDSVFTRFVERIGGLQSDSPTAVVSTRIGRDIELRLVETAAQPTGRYTYAGQVRGTGKLTVASPVVLSDRFVQVFTGAVTLAGGESAVPLIVEPRAQVDVRGQVSGLTSSGTVYGVDGGNPDNKITTLVVQPGLNSILAPGESPPPDAPVGTLGAIGVLRVGDLGLPVGEGGGDAGGGDAGGGDAGGLATFQVQFTQGDVPDGVLANSQLVVTGRLADQDGVPVANPGPFALQLDLQLGDDFARVPGRQYTLIDVVRPDVRFSPASVFFDRVGDAVADGGTFVAFSRGEPIQFRLRLNAGTDANDVVLIVLGAAATTVEREPGVQPVDDADGTATFLATFSGPVNPFEPSAVRVQTTGDVTFADVAVTRLTDRTARITVSGLTGAGTVDVSLPFGATNSLAGDPTAASLSPLGDGGLPVNVVRLAAPVPPPPPPTEVPGLAPGPVPPPAVTAARLVVGAGPGAAGLAAAFQGSGVPARQFGLSAADFAGGVRVAAADFTGDGVVDFVFASGPGGPSVVRVVDGTDASELFTTEPFERTFTGGIYVAAGDVTGDGVPDLVVSPDEGGGPRVQVYAGAAGFAKVADFFGIDDPLFRGGARPAVGDVNGDGAGDLVVAAGFGGGPRVAVWDGRSVATGAPVQAVADFFAFELGLRNGTFVTATDLNGDGFADILAGAGPGGGPRVVGYSGKALRTGELVTFADFFPGDPAARGGVRVAVADFDGDGIDEFVTGAGEGDGSRVQAFDPLDLRRLDPRPKADFDAFPGFNGGVFVA